VGHARRTIRQALAEGGREDLLEDAELLVSEVVTNALVHAGTDMELVASVHDGGLRVELGDGSPHLPARRDYAGLAGTGRGLRLLEQLVSRWGVRSHSAGKVVWFELGVEAGAPDRSLMDVAVDEPATPPAVPVDETLTVVLFDVPLLLHAAWQMQAESVLREYLLTRLTDEDSTTAIEDSAACNDAMSVLLDQVPAPELGEDPAALMAAATEPLVTGPRVLLQVPAASVANFALLDRTLADALDLADQGGFLTAPTQPELRVLRRWLCDEVRSQSQGGEPAGWALGADVLAPPTRVGGSPEVAHVAESELPMIAADNADRMVAVSRSAAELLGYAAPSRLVGRRLIDIIPERYRQAHLAGFTLHLATGRSPLLGRPVTVPALRADGSEVTLRLSVSRIPDPDGQDGPLFVAELEEPPAA
jgi:PAS domain S-box-containing protein